MTHAAQPTQHDPAHDRDGRQDAPDAPTDLRPRAWRAVLSRTVREFKDDNLTVWAAALTYYGVLAIFPALIALVSILGLVGTSATQPLLENLAQVAPGPAKDILSTTLENLQKSRGSAGVMFFVGLGLALWSASGYVAGFMQASNAIYDIPEGRPIWKTVPLRVGVTAVLVVLLAVSAVAVVLTGSIATQAGNVIGVGDTAVDDLGHRQVADPRADRQPDVRDPVLRGAQREAPRLSVGDPGRHPRGGAVDHRVAGVRLLRGELRLLQQDLRGARGAGDLPSCGCGSPTSRCCSEPSSMPSSSVAGVSKRATRPTRSHSPSRATLASSPRSWPPASDDPTPGRSTRDQEEEAGQEGRPLSPPDVRGRARARAHRQCGRLAAQGL